MSRQNSTHDRVTLVGGTRGRELAGQGHRRMTMARRILVLGSVAATAFGCSPGTDVVTFPSQEARRQPPYAEGAAVGEDYEDYVLYTHCGVTHAEIDGTYWEATPPQVVEAGPPPGWANPVTKGTLTIESETTATFYAEGVTARFARADAQPPACM